MSLAYFVDVRLESQEGSRRPSLVNDCDYVLSAHKCSIATSAMALDARTLADTLPTSLTSTLEGLPSV
jgi:hypothetical protein